jgi:hypothetical protein
MGGGKPPALAGKMMNEEFMQSLQAKRAARSSSMQQQNDEIFQTLSSAGQKPYSSPYAPEDLNAPMSDQNPNIFDYRKFFETGRFG